MNATSISFGLFIVLFTILLLHWMRKVKPQVAGYGSQRMCPSCGLITSRLKANCLECGKPFTAVLYSTSEITATWLGLPKTFQGYIRYEKYQTCCESEQTRHWRPRICEAS